MTAQRTWAEMRYRRRVLIARYSGRPLDAATSAPVLGVTARQARRVLDDLTGMGLARKLPNALPDRPGRPRRQWEIKPPYHNW